MSGGNIITFLHMRIFFKQSNLKSLIYMQAKRMYSSYDLIPVNLVSCIQNTTPIRRFSILGKTIAPVLLDEHTGHLQPFNLCIDRFSQLFKSPSEVHRNWLWISIGHDGFGVTKTKQRSVTGIYFVLDNFNSELNNLRENRFLIGYVPNGYDFSDVVTYLKHDLTMLQVDL